MGCASFGPQSLKKISTPSLVITVDDSARCAPAADFEGAGAGAAMAPSTRDAPPATRAPAVRPAEVTNLRRGASCDALTSVSLMEFPRMLDDTATMKRREGPELQKIAVSVNVLSKLNPSSTVVRVHTTRRPV